MAQSKEKPKITVKVDEIPGPDFTVYDQQADLKLLSLDFKSHVVSEVSETGELQNNHSYPVPASIQTPDGNELYGRALISSAYAGSVWSITLRTEAQNQRPTHHDFDAALESALRSYGEKLKSELQTPQKPRGKLKLRDVFGYWPRGLNKFSELMIDEPDPLAHAHNPPRKEVFLNDVFPLCEALYKLLFPRVDSSADASGLIAITGTTDSSKSIVTRGLIFLYMEARARRARETGQRKPHLVTFEDPIEQYFLKNPVTKTVPDDLDDLRGLLDAFYIDYSPREKKFDANSLKEVTSDALRQTPSVLFVGETREKCDWKDLLDFAGSGHLVITTAHASSIVEAMTGIFRDTDTRTPAQRSEMARRILGLINIRSFRPQVSRKTATATPASGSAPANDASSVRALLPALWKNTPQSRNNLIADGLASLLPALGPKPEIGYYSRTHFAEQLTEDSLMTEDIKADPQCSLLVKDIRRKATEWDMEGI